MSSRWTRSAARDWIGRWLAPETTGRAWAALAVKAAATVALVLVLAAQGVAPGGWTQSAIVALVVILLLALESFVPFSDLGRVDGLGGRLRVSITTAMAVVGVAFGGYFLLLALRRPLALAGLALVSVVATFVPPPPARHGGRIIPVTVAGGLAAWAWAAGPTVGAQPSVALLGHAVPATIICFVSVVVVQVLLALRARQWGFPVLVLATAAGPVAHLFTRETAGVVPVNLIVLPVLAIALLLGRSSRVRLVDAGEVIRWSLLSLVAIDLTAAASMATGPLQAGVLALTLLTLGAAPLVLAGRGGPRIRVAGLVCAIFTALVATLGVGVHLPDQSTSLLEQLDALTSAFFWMIAFPVSAALSAATARPGPRGVASPAQ